MMKVFYLLLLLPIIFSIGVADAIKIPPTPAIKMINTTSANVTAHNYADFVSFEGVGITITPDYELNKITFSATAGSSPNELYCAGGEFFNAYNETTNNFNCVAGAGGEVNTASSDGLGESLVKTKVGVNLPFKGIACGGDLQCSSNTTDITISYSGTPMGSSALDDLTDVIITSPAYLSTLFYNGAEWIDKIFSVNTQSPTNGNFITGINNQTGVITTQTLKVNVFDIDCSDTQQINRLQYDNQTGIFTGTCETDETGSGGTPRGGYLVAMWTQSTTKTNIGTSFVDVYTQTNSNGKAVYIDTDTFTTMRLQVEWNKVGGGTQTCQVITTGGTVAISTNVVSGTNDSGFDAIPVGLLNAENNYKIQCKSTTSTDDPIFESAAIWIK